MIGIRGQLNIIRNPECTACELHKSSQHVCVMGRGNPHARIMLVGEAPGEAEGRTGKPFMGAAGQLLNRLLKEVDLLDQVYITNICKCRPPKNRAPTLVERHRCIKLYLFSEIDIIKPDVIVALGKVAMSVLVTNKGVKRGEISWEKYRKTFVHVIPTWHPAYPLHSGLKQPIKDIRKVLAYAKELSDDLVRRNVSNSQRAQSEKAEVQPGSNQ